MIEDHSYYLTPTHHSTQKKIFVMTSANFSTSNGPIILFNDGLVCSPQHSEKLRGILSEKGFRYIIHHYRGHFNSSPINDPDELTFELLARDVKFISDHFSPDLPVYMVGHSMGVNVTLEVMRRFPDCVTGSVLIGGTVFPVTEVMLNSYLMTFVFPQFKNCLNYFPETSHFLWKNLAKTPILGAITTGLIRYTGFNPQQTDQKYVERYLNRIGQLGPELFVILFEEMMHQKILPYLEEIKVKTLVLAGDKDSVIPVKDQKTIARLMPNAHFSLISEGGHVPQNDFPEKTAEEILNFFFK